MSIIVAHAWSLRGTMSWLTPRSRRYVWSRTLPNVELKLPALAAEAAGALHSRAILCVAPRLLAVDGAGGRSDLYVYDLKKPAKVLEVDGFNKSEIRWPASMTLLT